MNYSLHLVQEVEKYPVQYNFKLNNYSKRDKVDSAQEMAAKEMNVRGKLKINRNKKITKNDNENRKILQW